MTAETAPFDNHAELAAELFELVTIERRCIAELRVDDMLEITEQRMTLTRYMSQLAETVPVPDEVAALYRRVQRIAQDNYTVLESAHGTVKGLIDRIAIDPAPTYRETGKASRSRGAGTSIWKG